MMLVLQWLRRLTVLLSFAVALLGSSAAYAQTSDADKATARALAIDAQQALEAEKFAKAADLFKRAEALYHAPTLGLGLGRAYRGMGRYVQARETFNRVTREKLPADASPQFKQAIKDARQEADQIKSKIAWITITVIPVEASVSVDGATLPSAALGVRRAIDPGEHTITTSAEGYTPDKQTVTLGEGDTKALNIALKSGAGSGTVPSPGPGSGSGNGSGGGTADSGDPGGLMRTLGFVALGVGGASLITGAISGGLATSKHGEISDQCPDDECPESLMLTDDIKSFQVMGNVSTATFIVGGVLAATGLVLVLVAPSGDEEPATTDASARQRPPAPRYRAHIGPSYLGASFEF